MTDDVALRREKRKSKRMWVEVVGLVAIFSQLLFLIVQTRDIQKEMRLQRILSVEDSERFINQLSLDRPEAALLLENSEKIIKLMEHLREAKESEGASYVFQEEDENLLLSLLPVRDSIEFRIALEMESLKPAEKHRAFAAVAAQMNARLRTFGYILLQEFEKMYRLCSEGITEEIFWRGEDAFEANIENWINRPPIKNLLLEPKEKKLLVGFHPHFRNYLDHLRFRNQKPTVDCRFPEPEFLGFDIW